MKNVRRAIAVVCSLACAASMTSVAGAARQARPDFSGTWRFHIEASVASAQTAKMVAGPIFGDEFVAEQSTAKLTLKISAGTLRVTAVYALDGSVSKNASPPSTPDAAPIEVSSTARWESDRLVIVSKSESPGPTGPVAVESTRTMWLDAEGRLVIERTGTPRELVPPSRSVYARVP